ncbi:hypothetical protein [Nonomuraea endophytica]|uniref:hypothetical protein n=1 Tax=Nonomuraea endophytica TaxID=714136 RepID=UPI0037CC02A5
MATPSAQQGPPPQRDRWTAQWWAAIFTVIAALASIAALIISINALKVSEQQRVDAVAQRAEDQQERAKVQAEASAAENSAFARKFTLWVSDERTSTELRWDFRNANPQIGGIYLKFERYNKSGQALPFKFYHASIEPCSAGSLILPKKWLEPNYEVRPRELIGTNFHDPPVRTWDDAGEPVDLDTWEMTHDGRLGGGYDVLIPKKVRKGVLPCD